MSLESFVESSEFCLEEVIPVVGEDLSSSISSAPCVHSWIWPPSSEERQRTTVGECDQHFDCLLGAAQQHRANLGVTTNKRCIKRLLSATSRSSSASAIASTSYSILPECSFPPRDPQSYFGAKRFMGAYSGQGSICGVLGGGHQ